VYDRRIGGRELTFGVSGKLHANSLVMYDHQTESLWSHLVGAAVTGPMKGQKLIALPYTFTQWETWKKIHPKTKVLTAGRDSLFSSVRDPYESYYRSPDTGIMPRRLSDQRIYPKEYVLGLVINGKAKAYPFSVLSRQAVINDLFQSLPLLVVFDAESATGVIYSRKAGGTTLTFKQAQRPDKRELLLVDDVARSTWEGLTGKAVEGKLKGKRLSSLPSTPSFWFGWVDHYPDTALYLDK
jgi:hypothetical protein